MLLPLLLPLPLPLPLIVLGFKADLALVYVECGKCFEEFKASFISSGGVGRRLSLVGTDGLWGHMLGGGVWVWWGIFRVGDLWLGLRGGGDLIIVGLDVGLGALVLTLHVGVALPLPLLLTLTLPLTLALPLPLVLALTLLVGVDGPWIVEISVVVMIPCVRALLTVSLS